MPDDPTHPLGPRAQARHDRILDAARRVFVRQSVDDTTVDDIAQEAGLSRATFYRAFTGVEAVIQELYTAYTQHVLGRLARTLPSGPEEDPEEWLDRVVAGMIEDVHAQGPLLRVLFREELRPGSDAARFHVERIENQIVQISQWWITATGMPADATIIHCLVLLFQAVTLHVARQDTSPDERERFRKALRFILRAVVDTYRADLGGDA